MAWIGASWRFGPATKRQHPHTHDFDEYMIVMQGCYILIVNGERIQLNAGEEYVISRGIPHGGEVRAGTRTIHAFGGHRANRI